MNTLNRRELIRFGLLTTGAALSTRLSRAEQGSGSGVQIVPGDKMVSSSGITSPKTTPWAQPLFRPPVATPRDPNNPNDFGPAFCTGKNQNNQDVFSFEPSVHQRWDDPMLAPKKYYKIDLVNANWSFHPDLPPASMYTYGGTVPGTMIHARYGEGIVVRWNNKLSDDRSGVGIPESAIHLHNLHCASESDGFPGDFVTLSKCRDHHYPMIRAGYDQYKGTGDPRESLGTLWYHDHHFNYTAKNVYKGLYGMFNAFDEYDTGEENTGYRLPAGPFDAASGGYKYDVMLAFSDPQFDANGKIFFNVFDNDGHLGDKIAVNGKVQPYMKVEPRRYRFRLLDAGPSRFYQFFLCKAQDYKPGNGNWQPMTLIANDGNLLENSLNNTQSVLMGVANRMDVVIDFSKYKGQSLYLVNRLEQTSGRGPSYNLLDPGYAVLRFDVAETLSSGPDLSNPDLTPGNSRPAALRPLPKPSSAELATAVQRTFKFDRSNGGWTVNGQLADITKPTFAIKQGDCEIWTLQNNSGSWSHPIHIHFEEFQILQRSSVPNVEPHELCRKDVLLLRPNESVKVFFRFRDFLGKYVMHCHNVVHEDDAMMLRWDIVPKS